MGGGECFVDGSAVAAEQSAVHEEPVAVLLDRSGRGGDELVTGFDDDAQVTEDQFLFTVGGAGEVADVGAGIGGCGGVGVTHRLVSRVGFVDGGVHGQPDRGQGEGVGLVVPARLGDELAVRGECHVHQPTGDGLAVRVVQVDGA